MKSPKRLTINTFSGWSSDTDEIEIDGVVYKRDEKTFDSIIQNEKLKLLLDSVMQVASRQMLSAGILLSMVEKDDEWTKLQKESLRLDKAEIHKVLKQLPAL